MTVVDWVIVGFTALLALHGYSRGFIVGAMSLIGFALGAVLGARLAPLVLSRGDRSPYAPLLALAGALLIGGILATGFEGIGRVARTVLRIPGLRLLDGLAGAALTGCIALGIVWIVGALILQTETAGALRRDVERSVILRRLDQVLPPSGPILHALDRLDPLPSLNGPAADVAPPPSGIVDAPGVRSAAASVVRVLGTACGFDIEGSGWIAAPGLVVTNAHVVAGESDTTVQVRGSGPAIAAAPVVFDPRNDIAVLRVFGNLDEPALSFASAPSPGTPGAILGYPEDGPFDAQPGRLGNTAETETENAYGQGPVLRDIASLRGLVRPGNSGGPLVDSAGRVLATVFATVTDPPAGQARGLAVPDAVVRGEIARAQRAHGLVGSGPCAD
jgi:S1-C subfamily serine protease